MSKPKPTSKVTIFRNGTNKNVKEFTIETDIMPGDEVKVAHSQERAIVSALIIKDDEIFYEVKRSSPPGEPYHIYDEYERSDLRKAITAEVKYEV